MPIYEYQCSNCGHRLEKLQKISDDPLTTCPDCGQDALDKLVSAAGFRLKGGGWYETDFKKDGKKNLAGDDKPAKSDSSKDAGGDAKPAKSTSSASSSTTSSAAA
ncbi:zinc ribbon domain-containing protein [Wenzhouxiangella sp. XN79A]|uniref:FmdB family zinc ribbon protein n=1 Tax=Wenzhouxiangella sp. XN79A TaxID=2724193 RepID=UPI00144A5B34|nr:zinc ribbon domain-containing protein [Wenzhouxiangella sp. XN79A]NKI36071.1 zinc ribbon domain-containing protein [Wenzhouxiangella sp. XN79A]